ncbi:MAG: right-handed parallel beta-helix repeat-containing protein [Actinobacteria bacterium]|nr:right-handed parallel beta-helix repeat-containing protein [Actinomycetota bacterium]MBU1944301.1 right-handed parallel beta-helix repeat-containing protein [Actinomycetota bacterium]MBU2688286.1 right-handed parallel beta-helix repeat-containing protein [Actinomycetota bacterium]
MKAGTVAVARIALLFVVLAVMGTVPARAAGSTGGDAQTYYVSPSGLDSNPGTLDKPFKTPGYASKQIQAGDTLIIQGGRYVLSTFYDDMITPPTGTATAPIIIKGEEGNRPVLAGRDNLFSAVDIGGTSYITIENLEITSDNGALFRGGIAGSSGPVDHLTLKDLYIHHIDEGAMDFADLSAAIIQGCVMSYCGFGCLGGPVGQQGGWRDVTVRGCTLSYSGHYYQGGPGPSPYDRPDGFGVEPSEGPIEIVDTVAEHNRGDGLDSKCRNTHIHECVVANNSCDGVKLWGDGSRVENTLVYGTGDGVGGASPWAGLVIGTEQEGADFEIVNCAIADNPEREAYPMYVEYGGAANISVLFRNNIVADGYGAPYFAPEADLTLDHCILYSPDHPDNSLEANGKTYSADELEAGAVGEGVLCDDPKFLQPAWGSAGDYHLEAGSPAIDSGSSDGAPAIDLDGAARPFGAGYDIGPYEYGALRPVTGERTWGTGAPGVTQPGVTWYLAEGCTAGGFETWVLVQNPNSTPATVDITYMTGEGEKPGPRVTLPPDSRATVNAADTVGQAWEVSAKASSNVPVVVERAMYWGGRTGAHGSTGVSGPATDWYLAEGCTAGGFETWVLLQNPGSVEANAQLTFMTDTGQVTGPLVVLPPGTRRTVNVAETVGEAWNVSTGVDSDEPVVAERAMYWNGRAGGHDSVGVTAASKTWYLAEGSTGGTFETWLLLQNPGDVQANAQVTFMTDAGPVTGPSVGLPPGTRRTVNVAETVGAQWSVSTEVSSDQQVVAERAVYWDGRREGHDSAGVTSRGKTWYVAEGCTGQGFQTWILVQNPGTQNATVSLEYMTGSRQVTGPTLILGPRTRRTVNVADTCPGEWSVSTKVTSSHDITVERAVYGVSP